LGGSRQFLNDDKVRSRNSRAILGQSLLDFLDVDMDKFIKSFAQLSEQLSELHELPVGQDIPHFEVELHKFGQEHIFFQFVRLDWLERLDAYKRQNENWRELLRPKEFSQIPQRVITLQNQVRRLIEGALDIALRKTRENFTTLSRVKSYYNGTESGKFDFGQITTEFSCQAGLFGDVLVPRKLEDILSYLLREFIKREQHFKTCLHCGKYFVPDHGNAEYCNRVVANSKKTCRDIGATKNYREKMRLTIIGRRVMISERSLLDIFSFFCRLLIKNIGWRYCHVKESKKFR